MSVRGLRGPGAPRIALPARRRRGRCRRRHGRGCRTDRRGGQCCPRSPFRSGRTPRSHCSRKPGPAGASRAQPTFRASISTPWLAAPSPKNATATRPCTIELCSQGRADGQPDAAADDAVGPEDAAAEIGHVHRAAPAVADAVLAAEDLGDQRLGSPPLARKCPWPRCVLAIQSWSVRWAQTPTATASWPTYK